MNKIKLLALFGESSAGKDSIQHWLERELKNSHGMVSYTSRPPRDYETEGREYHFVSQSDFEKMIQKNKMLEFSCFNDWYYGTYINELQKDKINIGVFNPQGIRSLLKKVDDSFEILPVWVQAPEKIRLLRSLSREKDPNCTEICRRFLADKRDFSNINFDYEIYLNDKNNEDYYGFLKRPKVANFLRSE